jgi:hypothetical protein
MQPSFEGVNILFPGQPNWTGWAACGGEPPFSAAVVDFLGVLSNRLLKDPAVRAFPDVATFAFFCRRGNLTKLREEYGRDARRLGRGILFHIAPSNVPINFAYSLVAGLLSGNRNIVRVSSEPFVQVDLVLQALAALADEHPAVAGRIAIVRYDRANAATAEFSRRCDVRIIWGGDETIEQIRRNSLSPRAFDLTFADRYSLAVIDAPRLLEQMELRNVAEGFYNDTYLFDQNACSAPHLVVWLGGETAVVEARERFWRELTAVLKAKYEFQPAMAVRKLAAFYTQATAMPIQRVGGKSNALWRVTIPTLAPGIENYRCIGGYYTEYLAGSLDEIAPIVTRRYQTLAYFGVDREALGNFVSRHSLPGIDRIVPFGSTTEFSLNWDGYDLIQTLTRKVSLL